MNAQVQSSPITVTVVPTEKRLAFLPKKFPRHYLRIERSVFARMTEMDATYTGGYWEFYDLSNGGCYLALQAPRDQRVRMVAPNQSERSVSYDAAGIVVTLYAINRLCNSTEKDEHINAYYFLRDFAQHHAEWEDIAALID